MKNSILLSRAGATAAAIPGACLPVPIGVLAYAVLGVFACPAAAFTPSSKAGGENTPLNLNSSTDATHSTSGGGASLVRTIVGLAIVIAVIWGLAWILRQVKAGKGGAGPDQSSEGLASVAALTLGSGRSVHLVRAGSDYVLLGSTEHGVAPIHRYTEEQAQEAGLLLQERPPERSRLIGAAGALVAGATRAVGQAGYSERSAFSGDEDGGVGEWPHEGGRGTYVSPVAGRRPDPMRMPSPSSSLIDRLREMTVRR